MKYLTEEDRLHIEVKRYLEIQYPTVTALHVPNEGKRSRWEAMKAKRMGLKAGVADWLIFAPKGSTVPGLALELKSLKGRLTEKQEQFLTDMDSRHGWETGVARTFDEAKDRIDTFLNGKG